MALSYFDKDRTSFSNGTASDFKGERQRIDYRGSYDSGGFWTLNFGADYTEEEDDNLKIDITGVQAELLIAPTDALDLAFSLRNDDHSEFSSEWSSRAALAWRIREDVILRASASDGFRAPTLFQLDPFFGNPAFQPETSTSYDLGIEKRFGADGFVRATLFQTEIDDQIFFDGTSTRCDAARFRLAFRDRRFRGQGDRAFGAGGDQRIPHAHRRLHLYRCRTEQRRRRPRARATTCSNWP